MVQPPRSVRRLLAVPTAALVGLVTLASCSSGSSTSPGATDGPARVHDADAAPPTVVAGTIATPHGLTRTYRLVIPRGSDPDRPRPLLVALHGGVGSGRQFERNSGFTELAIRHDFIVVYPDGIEIGGAGPLRGGHVWNGGKCCGRAYRENVDDVGFISTLVGRIVDDQDVDSDRIYATGHSNGAIMAYRLACERADLFAAIGVQAGAIEIDDCAPTQPVSVLAIHGTADTNIPIEGGRGTGLSATEFSSPTAAVESFARFDGCRRSTTRTADRNRDVEIERWRGCRAATAVEFVRVTGANHAWMGHESTRAALRLVGASYRDFDSSAAIWEFLAAHPRRR